MTGKMGLLEKKTAALCAAVFFSLIYTFNAVTLNEVYERSETS